MFLTGFNADPNEISAESALDFTGEQSMTKQSFKEECDINTLVRQFGITGQIPTDVRQPQYGDFTAVTDYQTALNAVIAAQESFAAMPADVRRRFANDPALFVEFCSDPANRDEAIKLGLIEKPLDPPGPIRVEVVPPSSGGTPGTVAS